MPIKSTLINGPDGKVLHASTPFDAHTLLITSNFFETHGVFRTAQITTATTTPIASPGLGGYLIVTNILLSAPKDNLGEVTVEFDDGTHTEILFSATLANQPVRIPISIPSGWRGWANAEIKVITATTAPTSVTVGYVKLLGGESYGAWDARR